MINLDNKELINRAIEGAKLEAKQYKDAVIEGINKEESEIKKHKSELKKYKIILKSLNIPPTEKEIDELIEHFKND